MMRNKALNKHDLIAILRTFSDKELKRFSSYLASDYFSTRRALKVLYEELRKYHPHYIDVNCRVESLYKIVYPDLNYNGGTMRDLLSSLYKTAVDFISLESFLNGQSPEHLRINELRKRGLPEQAGKSLNDIITDDEILKNVDSEYFLHNYNLQIEKVNLNIIYKSHTSVNSVEKLGEEIKKAEIYIKIFSTLEILTNYINLLIFEERFNNKESGNYINAAIKEFRVSSNNNLLKFKSQYDFIVEIYTALLEAFYKRGNYRLYENYKELVKKHKTKFSSDELSFHYSRLISCCIFGAKCPKVKDEFNVELFTLYNLFLENKYYRNNKTRYIPSNLFRAILLHAAKMKKLSWLIKVINKHINDLQPTVRVNMKQYALALYYYSSGRGGEALEAIGKLNITQFMFKYDIYNLKLRIFYEEKDLVAAMELINTYRQFLRTDKMMPAARKLFHRNFMKYSRRLIMISEGSKKFEAGLEIQKLQNEDCVYKEWLIEKLSLFDTSHKNYLRTG